MNKLRTAFASESGLFLLGGTFASALLYGSRSFPALLGAVLLGAYLYRRRRRLFWMGLTAGILLIARDLLADVWPNQSPSVLEGVIVDKTDRSFEVSTRSGRWLVDCFDACVGVVGDIVRVEGEPRTFDPKRIDGSFDYDSYLQANGLRGRFRTSEIRVEGKAIHPAVLRVAFFRFVDHTFQKPAAAMIRYALFGDSSAMDEASVIAVRRAGIAHLFAVSGLHLTLMVGFLKSMWHRLFWREDRFAVLLILFLLSYNLLTGWTPSLLRASLISLIAAFPSVKGKLANTDWLMIIGLTMLFWNPALSRHVGFQLSFLATSGMYLFAGKTNNAWSGTFRTASMVVLVTLPILLSMQGEISIWVVFSTVAFGWAVTRVLLPATIVTLLIPPLQALYLVLTDGFLVALTWLDAINVTIPLTLGGIFWLWYWLALLPCLARFFRNESWMRQAALLLGVVTASQWLSPMAFVPRVDVLDVNQGDAIWIESPSCRMLIDTGDVDDYDTVLKSLLRRGIRKMDVLLITHRHADHDGELSDLIASISVDRLVFGRMPEQAFASSVEVVEAGQTLVCGKLRFEVLSADRRANNENDNSIVLKGTIGNDVWLFMADAERAVEQELLRQPFESVDIIKVGHHGGKTSTGLPLLQAANPQIAIISVGRPNKYNHPHDDVLKRLEDQAIDVYRTDRNGTITIWTCGSLRIIQTAKEANDRIWTFLRRIRIEST